MSGWIAYTIFCCMSLGAQLHLGTLHKTLLHQSGIISMLIMLTHLGLHSRLVLLHG